MQMGKIHIVLDWQFVHRKISNIQSKNTHEPLEKVFKLNLYSHKLYDTGL